MTEIAGLKLIVPTSVAGSGVSVSASGKVTFTSSATININGCFTSSYDNYLLVMRCKNSTTDAIYARLRVSGTDASGSNYARQYLYADGTGVFGARSTSQTVMILTYVNSTDNNGTHLYLYGPNLAQPTAVRTANTSHALNTYLEDDVNTHSLSTAYDGITIYPGTGNMTGSLTIYGLSQ